MAAPKTKVTIYDVAARAGVAISTVSRVLNNSTDVSDGTRAKVLRAIDDLKYRPDRTAKKLAQQRTQTLAIALPTFTTPFHNEFLKGVRFILQDREIDLLLCDLGWRDPVRTLLNFLKRGTVDGILLVGIPTEDRVSDELESLHAPAVLVGSEWSHYDSFVWDDAAGAHEAVRHLIRQGHRRIGMIRSFTKSAIQQHRIEGYQQALSEAGIELDPELMRIGITEKHEGYNEEAGYEAMQDFMTLSDPPTAVFASSDVHALGAWHACTEAGLRVPQDVALVGYDDIKMSRYIGLSSVSQGMQRIGREATARLIDRIEGGVDARPETVSTTPSLSIRRSSRFVRD